MEKVLDDYDRRQRFAAVATAMNSTDQETRHAWCSEADSWPVIPIEPGSVVWVDLDPRIGRGRAGRRPAVVIASLILPTERGAAIVDPLGWPEGLRS